jgi:hypothetical protein
MTILTPITTTLLAPLLPLTGTAVPLLLAPFVAVLPPAPAEVLLPEPAVTVEPLPVPVDPVVPLPVSVDPLLPEAQLWIPFRITTLTVELIG